MKFINSLGKGAGTRVLVNTADPFSSFFTRNKAAVTTESTEESKYIHFLPGSGSRKAAPTPGGEGGAGAGQGRPVSSPHFRAPAAGGRALWSPVAHPRKGRGGPPLRVTQPCSCRPPRPPQLAFPHRLGFCPRSPQTERSRSRRFSLWARCPHPGPGTVLDTRDQHSPRERVSDRTARPSWAVTDSR